jgi:hypothetical protein
MAYSVLADVQSLIKWITFDATSKVTSTEVTSTFIAEADAYIDSKLERIYAVPVTDADDIEILRYISCRKAACAIAKVLMLQASGQFVEIVKSWCEDAETKLQEILDGTVTLPNTTEVDTTSGLYSYMAHGNGDNDYAESEPIWKRTEDQW